MKNLMLFTIALLSLQLHAVDYGTDTLTPAQVVRFRSQQPFAVTPTDDPIAACVTHLQQVMCVSDAGQGGYDDKCDATRVTPEMTKLLPGLVQSLPPFHQQVFCHIARLQVHTSLDSIAYADEIRDANHQPIGTMIGARLDVLLGSNPNHNMWSWKEQLNFGLSQMNDPNYTLSPVGPLVTEIIGGPDSVMMVTFTHEVGHLIDFLNHANQSHCAMQSDQIHYVCQFPADSYAALSWGTQETYTKGDWGTAPETKALYPWLSQMCYYGCKSTIAPDKIPDVYQELRASSLLTSYSSSDYMEDFAEASMIWSLKNSGMPFTYQIVDLAGVAFDTSAQWQTPQTQPKIQWLAKFFGRTDLIYQFPSPNPVP